MRLAGRPGARRGPRLARGLALGLLVLLLAAPLGSAAQPRLGAAFPPLPFLKPGEERTFEGNLTYSYDEAGAGQTNLSVAPQSGPSWLTARVEPASASVGAASPDGKTVLPVRLTLGVRPGTAALELHTLQLRLEAGANAPLNATSATVGVPVRVAFVGALRVEAPPRQEGRPGEPLNVALRVANEGNGPTRVSFEQRAGDASGLVVVLPGPLLAETRGLLQDRVVNASLLAQQPGSYAVALVYSSTHAFDQSLLGAAGEVRFAFEVASTGLLPAPDPLLPLALAAVALAALRRRR